MVWYGMVYVDGKGLGLGLGRAGPGEQYVGRYCTYNYAQMLYSTTYLQREVQRIPHRLPR